MTTNLVECINGTLKGVRHLPIAAMVKATYYRMVNLFVTKSDEAVAQKTGGNGFSVFLETQMQHNVATAGRFQVITFDGFHNIFEVKDKRSDTRYAVDMLQRYCDCGDFQIDRFPCRHAVACCNSAAVNWRHHVDSIYSIDEVIKVYATKFKPIGHRDCWPVYNGPIIEPDQRLIRDGKGRPKSTRFLNEMDSARMRRQNRCGLCRQPGHRLGNCPNRQ